MPGKWGTYKVINVDYHNRTITVRNLKKKKVEELIVGDEEILKILEEVRGKIKLKVEDEKVIDIKAEIKGTFYGIPFKKLRSMAPDGAKKVTTAAEIFDLAGTEAGILAIVVLFAFLIGMLIYYLVLYMVVYVVASIITLGEVWRMRHKSKISLPLSKKTIGKIRDLIRETVEKGGAVRGIPESLIDPKLTSRNSKIAKTFLVLDIGKILIGLAIATLIVIFLEFFAETLTYQGFLEYLAKDLWLIPLALGTLGFALIIISGILHRVLKS